MSKRIATLLAGAALGALLLPAMPARAQTASTSNDEEWRRLTRAEVEQLVQELTQLPIELTTAEIRAQMQAQLAQVRARIAAAAYARGIAQEDESAAQAKAEAKLRGKLAGLQAGVGRLPDDDSIFLLGGEGGWLGVSIEEVTSDKAKELKLPAERGVLVTEVDSDSPAAKAGLKANDVITEYNGQHVEGAAEFRRLIRETPPGRTAQLAVWRDGRSQSLSAQLGDSGEQMRQRMRVIMPKDFTFKMTPPNIEFFGNIARTPMLGIGVQDLDGQLGNYFGAPEGEGVLVTEVRSGSPAEKAGLKAGDVITKIDGARVRNSGELRDHLREKRDSKTVSLTVIRKGAEVSVNVEVEQPKPAAPSRKTITYRTL